MSRIIAVFTFVFCASFLAPLHAEAQWRIPARQASVDASGWTYIDPVASANAPSNTVQASLNWLDRVWGDQAISGSAWSVLPRTNRVRSVFDWVDQNWPTNIVPTQHYLPGTNIPGFVFIDGQWISTNFLPGTNIVNAVFSNGQWYVTGSNATDIAVNPTNWVVLPSNAANVQVTLNAVDAFLSGVQGVFDSAGSTATFFFANPTSTLTYAATSIVPGVTYDIDKVYSGTVNPFFGGTGVFTNFGALSNIFIRATDTLANRRGGLRLPVPGIYSVSAGFGVTENLYTNFPHTMYLEHRRVTSAENSLRARHQALALGGENTGSSVSFYTVTTTNEYLFFSFTPSVDHAIGWQHLHISAYLVQPD